MKYKLSDYIPYKHDEESLLLALGAKSSFDPKLLTVDASSNTVPRLAFRLFLADLIQLPLEPKFFPPLNFAPLWTYLTCKCLSRLKKHTDTTKISVHVEQIESLLEENPEVMQAALKALAGFATFHTTVAGVEEFRELMILLMATYLKTQRRSRGFSFDGVEDVKAWEVLQEQVSIDRWWTFPFCALKALSKDWINRLLQTFHEMREIVGSENQEAFMKAATFQLEALCSFFSLEPEFIEALRTSGKEQSLPSFEVPLSKN